MNTNKIIAFSVGPIGSAALSFITLPIIAWFYSANDIGRVAMLAVFSNFCVMLFSLGLDQAYIREYYETESKPALLKTTLLPGLALLVTGVVLFLATPNLISKTLFSADSFLLSLLVALCIVCAYISRFLSLILRMQEKGIAFSMSQLLPKAFFLSIISSYVFFSFGFDLTHLIIAHTLSITSITLIFAWNTRHELSQSISAKINPTKLKSMLHFGMPLIVGGVAFWGLTSMDKLFLRSLSTFEELGVYSLASSFAAVAVIFQSIFSTLWAPTVYKWAAEGINTDKIDQATEHVLSAVILIFFMTGIFSWITSYIIPDEYKKVQYMLVACMAYPLFYTLSETTAIGIAITRKSGYSMLASFIAAFANLIGNYLIVPTHGAPGAAAVTATSFWIFLFVRTELSCFVWRKIRRVKLYISTLTCLLTSIGMSIYGEHHELFFSLLWLTIGGMGVIFFKDSLRAATSIIKTTRLLKN